MDLLLNQVFWYAILGAVAFVALIVFVIQQKRELGDGAAPKVESKNNLGTKLLFFRKMDDGTYLGTVWVIVCALPIVPLSTWRVTPLGVSTRRTGASSYTTFNVNFIERKPMGIASVALMYAKIVFHLAVMFGPIAIVTALLIVDTEWAKKTFTIGPIIVMVLAASASGPGYGAFLMWRHNRIYGKGLL
jgi:hypothetical protein